MSNAMQNLGDTLRQLPLLTSAQKVKLVREVLPRYAESRSLAKQLLDRGWLTPYQVNQLLAGRAEDLLVGAYILLERLGEGGTGMVFKARHQHLDRMVAIKMIRTEVLADQEVLDRFVREMEALGRVNHLNIVRAYDAGPAGGNWFLAMEYVQGADLNGLVKRKGPLPVAEACDVISQAAQGLQAIHERGMIHRDLKPANLLRTKKGIVKISDLGLARLLRPSDRTLTAAGSAMMGTVDYMAPEQAIDFHKADIRSDIYSLGCCFYFLLTGKPPFDGGTIPQVLLAHQQKEPPPVRPEVPPRVLAILHKMLAKRPQDRFQTPGEIVAALANPTAAGVQPAAGPPFRRSVPDAGQQAGGRRRTAAPARSRRALLAASFGAVVIGVAALLMFAFGSARDSDDARVNAEFGRTAPDSGNPKVTAEPVYLTDLQEVAVEGMGYKTINQWSKHGKVCNGQPITVKGVPSFKGLSTPVAPRGAALLRYQLSKKYRALQGSAAIADFASMSKGQWPLTFSVSGDGRVLWQSALADRGVPQAFAVDVSGVDRLDLMVSFPNATGAEYKYAGHASLGQASVWVDPRLVR